MSERWPPPGFAARECDGIRWIETELGSGVVRFTLAFDAEGRPLDLGSTGGGSAGGARLRLAAALGIGTDRIHVVRQVHGGAIVGPGCEGWASTVSFHSARPDRVEADGLVSPDPEDSLAVQVADCLPIAIVGPAGRALLHCGWRGLTTDLLEQAVRATRGEVAAIGPSIGPCCYQVGRDVAEALGVERSGSGTVDLQRLARLRLGDVGVDPVIETRLCTGCEAERFFSFRRQGQAAGRQMAIVSAR